MGAAAVLVPAVVVDLRRLRAVAVEADACCVRAGAGATLAHVDAALAPHGLMLGHDPWTVGVATVGGALATNGLGYLGARAGSFGAQVRALEAVLADGTIVRTRSSPARSTGLDLARLLVGTEGTLGIITEATLAVLPVPEERLIHAWRLPSFDAGVAIAAGLRRTGVRPACLELSADDTPGPATMLLVFDGLEGEAALLAARAAKLLATAGRALPGPPGGEPQGAGPAAGPRARGAPAPRGGGGGGPGGGAGPAGRRGGSAPANIMNPERGGLYLGGLPRSLFLAPRPRRWRAGPAPAAAPGGWGEAGGGLRPAVPRVAFPPVLHRHAAA